MRLLREWGFPVALLAAWWFGLVWALTLMIGPAPQPAKIKQARPIAPRIETRRS
jgi:hypothetical protein